MPGVANAEHVHVGPVDLEVPLDLRPLPARTVTVKLSGGAVRHATPVAPTVAAAAEAGGDGGDVVVSAQLRGGGGALFELQWD